MRICIHIIYVCAYAYIRYLIIGYIFFILYSKIINEGCWVDHLVEHPTLSFDLGHVPKVMGWSPMLDSILSMEPA